VLYVLFVFLALRGPPPSILCDAALYIP
jgi:hypothetical protein